MNRCAALFLALMLGCACAQTTVSDPGPFPLTGTSDDVQVKGQYSSVALDRVDQVSVETGRIVLHGPAGTVTIDPPAGVDTSQPTRSWALTTETQAGAKRLVTFTHATTIQDFTIELPAGDDEIRYGVFSTKQGGEVMVLAWGSNSRSYWGYVAIEDLRGSQDLL